MASINKKNKIFGYARFEDGKIVKPKEEEIKLKKIEKEKKVNLDYIYILKALQVIPFGVGRKLLMDFLIGDKKNQSIVKNKLYLKRYFGSMQYEKDELNALINNLIQNDLIELKTITGNKHWKILEIATKGKKEIENPTLYKRKLAFNYSEVDTEILEDEQLLFEKYDDFLKNYNNEQKKAIICNNSHILCIAGAGSGKTTVLTKRIEFLIKYCNVDPKKILAITFTRKARQEMRNRLKINGIKSDVLVETFNSFCEKILRQYNYLIYDKPVRVINYRDKVVMINNALAKINLDIQKAIEIYFSKSKQKAPITI